MGCWLYMFSSEFTINADCEHAVTMSTVCSSWSISLCVLCPDVSHSLTERVANDQRLASSHDNFLLLRSFQF